MMKFDRKQQKSVKQLSFKKNNELKQITKKSQTFISDGWKGIMILWTHVS